MWRRVLVGVALLGFAVTDLATGPVAGAPVVGHLRGSSTGVVTRTPAVWAGSTGPGPARRTPAWAGRLPAGTRQVIRTVSSDHWCRQVYCTVTQAWRKDRSGAWSVVRHFRSTIASKGWGKRREGDMRSPNGVYRIKVTFSTGRKAPGRMPWRRRRATSVVLNTPGRLYNTWVEQSWRTDGDRPSMRYGFVVDYNRVRLRPYVGPKPLAGKGSGIFYHTSKPGHRWAPTLGCTQVGNVDAMHWLVSWLRPGANPRVVQNL